MSISRLRALLSIVALGGAMGCTGRGSDAEAGGPVVEVVAPPTKEVAVVATDKVMGKVAEAEAEAAKDVGPGTKVEAGKVVGPETTKVEAAKHGVTTTNTAELEVLARVLAGEDAEVVEVVERRAVGREELVLLRWYGARAWRAQERRAGRLEAALAGLEAQVDACEATPGELSVCLEGVIADRHVMWSAAGREVFAWEVARVRDGAVLGRRRLFETSLRVDDVPHKFKAYDIDGDGRSELTVIVPVERPQHDQAMDHESGEVGFILEVADMHVQFSATRRYAMRAEDVGGSESTAETVWLARDVDGDGHADLQLRETTRLTDIAADDAPPAAPRSGARTTVCPYEPVADLWRCPEALGRQLLEASG
ncbi:hypothetical protein [Nannocystis bainbridge]|uniref:VCBS repeat-containing protein n=1 Tax=Nannocystis bainbridge TaxID=2995303 RepID=A0ABT5E9F7_9BACT|nr:hypothetical protein [Nannocystis bainbridge]MDC0721502.1 hypothetical protein [Nannocystis bainbridge]